MGSRHWASLPGIWCSITFCSVVALGSRPHRLPMFTLVFNPCTCVVSPEHPVFCPSPPARQVLAEPYPSNGCAHRDPLLLLFQVTRIPEDPCRRLLLEFVQADPAQSCCGPLSELCKGLIQACRKQAPKTDRVAGSTIDQAVNATFAALVCRTPDLYEKLQKYGNLYYREYFSSEGQLLSFKKAYLK